MITTIAPLKSARDRWLASGKDPKLLDMAVTALDAATVNTDVVRALGPGYVVKRLGSRNGPPSPVYGIYVGEHLMLKYQLHELGAEADVEVVA